MARLTFLGTGCGFPVPDRFYSSILFEAAGKRVLLDAGEPCSHVLRRRGIGFETLDAILISHGHSDHVGGLPMLLQGGWLSPRKRPMPICIPGELVDPLTHWLNAVYLPEKLIGFPIEWLAWEKSATFEIDGFKVSVAPTTHLNSLGNKIDPTDHTRFKAYSMAIESEGKRLVYSGDIGLPSDLESQLAGPVDVLVCELAHFTPETLFRFLAAKPVKRLVLTHLSPENQIGPDRLANLARDMIDPNLDVHVAVENEEYEF